MHFTKTIFSLALLFSSNSLLAAGSSFTPSNFAIWDQPVLRSMVSAEADLYCKFNPIRNLECKQLSPSGVDFTFDFKANGYNSIINFYMQAHAFDTDHSLLVLAIDNDVVTLDTKTGKQLNKTALPIFDSKDYQIAPDWGVVGYYQNKVYFKSTYLKKSVGNIASNQEKLADYYSFDTTKFKLTLMKEISGYEDRYTLFFMRQQSLLILPRYKEANQLYVKSTGEKIKFNDLAKYDGYKNSVVEFNADVLDGSEDLFVFNNIYEDGKEPSVSSISRYSAKDGSLVRHKKISAQEVFFRKDGIYFSDFKTIYKLNQNLDVVAKTPEFAKQISILPLADGNLLASHNAGFSGGSKKNVYYYSGKDLSMLVDLSPILSDMSSYTYFNKQRSNVIVGLGGSYNHATWKSYSIEK